MKRLFFVLLIVPFIAGCFEKETPKVQDPQALYQMYKTDDMARKAKIEEGLLKSAEEQAKDQAYAIACKARDDLGKEEMKKYGLPKLEPITAWPSRKRGNQTAEK